MRFRIATIATKRATHTLEQLHAELAGKLHECKREAKRLVGAMKHVEAVLKLLHSCYNLATIAVRRRKANPWFKRGTALRYVLEVLRAAERPLTPRDSKCAAWTIPIPSNFTASARASSRRYIPTRAAASSRTIT
jgi:hypothetical protein